MRVPLSKPKSSNEAFVTVSLTLRDQTAWASAGHEVAWTQWQVSKAASLTTSSFLGGFSSAVNFTSGARVTMSGPNYTFTFDYARGAPTSWTVNAVSILEADPKGGVAITPSFWRPTTDNDVRDSLSDWQRLGVDVLETQLRSLTVDTSDQNKEIYKAHTYISPPSLAWGFECEIDYTINTATGTLIVDVKKCKPTGAMPEYVPRAGLNLRLSKKLDKVKWFGLGPGESYPDKKAAQRTGVWDVDSVKDLQTPYEVPQENGNRMETRWVSLTDAHGTGVKAATTDGIEGGLFSWVASNHSSETIQNARHPPDLVEEDAILLRLDYKVAGVGTAACGPGVRDDLRVKVEDMSFGFVLESVGL